MGPLNPEAHDLMAELGSRLTGVLGDHRETLFLYQRLSVVNQKFNAVAIGGCMVQDDDEPVISVAGLMRTGAVQESDRPVWYDVYAAFPPRIEPQFDRPLQEHEPVEILYKEDIIRAKFYSTFASPDILDMKRADQITICQRFIDKYIEFESKSGFIGLGTIGDEGRKGKVFLAVAEALRLDGINLKSHAQIQEERNAIKRSKERKTKEGRALSSLGVASKTEAAAQRLSPTAQRNELMDDDIWEDELDSDSIKNTNLSKELDKQT